MWQAIRESLLLDVRNSSTASDEAVHGTWAMCDSATCSLVPPPDSDLSDFDSDPPSRHRPPRPDSHNLETSKNCGERLGWVTHAKNQRPTTVKQWLQLRTVKPQLHEAALDDRDYPFYKRFPASLLTPWRMDKVSGIENPDFPRPASDDTCLSCPLTIDDAAHGK